MLTVLGMVLCSAVRAQEAPTIAVVVPATAAVEELDVNDLALIFKRKKVFWNSGARIVPVNLPADSAIRRHFSRAVLQQSPAALEDYWNQQYFQGVLPPHMLASEAAVLRFVASTAHAIGYLSACAVDTSVSVLMVIDAEGQVRPPASVPACTTDLP
ncbi:MAG: hypothetical protein ACT4P0_01570 [Panacagrimonas sp.]